MKKDVVKNQADILAKMKISALNPMQEATAVAIEEGKDVMLISPTGTGKTLAFLLPLIPKLVPDKGIQLLILVPSRELAMQIEEVLRTMGTGLKVNAVYGGRSGSLDRMELKHPPAILVGTPGRVADHLRREQITTASIRFLVLDEFDKSLEVGFEKEMKEILSELQTLKQRVLTSATELNDLPAFVGVNNAEVIHFESDVQVNLSLKRIVSPEKDKLNTLFKALCNIGNVNGIVFCNFKESVDRVSDFLAQNGISHGCFHGGMEQRDRQNTLLKFRNGSQRLIIATDLAARGLDIPEIHFVLHYQLPPRSQEFIHRNGRTARMHKEGVAYILQWEEEQVPDFIDVTEQFDLQDNTAPPEDPAWKTLYISGGRKDKISKGDVAGLFIKQGALMPSELGVIEVKRDCAFVAVSAKKAQGLISKLNNSRLKKKKVRISLLA
jgi:superfamily II DNA/RNA helicase